MLRKIIAHLACLLILALAFTGCGTDQAAAAVETAETEVISQPMAEKRHISRQLSENHVLDADVYAPEEKSCESFALTPLSITPEEAADILFPEDDSQRTVENRTLTTQAGNRVRVESGMLDFSRDRDLDWEIENVLGEYARMNPGEQGTALDFMTYQEAQEYGEKLLKDLGVCFEPVLQTCVGLTHQQLEDYQQELFNRPGGYGFKTPVLTGLTEADDAYLLTFAFTWNGIPIYGWEGEPSMGYGPGGFPVFLSHASMVISRRGLTSLSVWEVYGTAEPGDTRELVDVEPLLDAYREHWAEFTQNNPQEKLRVNAIFLEYMPIPRDGTVTLVPYWCFPTEMELQNTFTGEKIWDCGSAERYNAFTGEDLTFGG